MPTDLIARYSELTAQGSRQVRHGEFRHAVESFEKARRIAEKLNDQQLLVKALCNLSTARLATGEIHEAERGLRQILLRSRDPQTIFVTSSNLASALRRQGRLEKALVYARRALEASDSLDNHSWKAASHNLVANIYMNMNYLDDAVAEYRFALTLAEKGGAEPYQPTDYIKENLGYCYLLKKKYRKGIAVILEALRKATENGNMRCIAESYQDLCFAHMQLRELSVAEGYGEKALKLATEQEFIDLLKNCYYLLGEVNLLLGEDQKSDYYFDRLQDLYPHLPVLKEFLRTFDVSNIINLKNPI